MSPTREPLVKWFVKEDAECYIEGGGFDVISAETPFYKASAVDPVLEELEHWLNDFIEWNACNEKEGVWRCNQCDCLAVVGEDSHLEDCDIVTAKDLLTRLRAARGL